MHYENGDLKMRILLLLALMLNLNPAFAFTEYFYSNQNAYDYCDGRNFQWCVDQVKARAEELADRDMRFRCEMRQGKWDNWSTNCSHFCTPNFLPIEAERQYTSCNSNCSSRCELP